MLLIGFASVWDDPQNILIMPVNLSNSIQKESGRLSSSLPAIQIAADRIAATILQGTHGRRQAGLGDTFWEFRPYQQGDPVSRVDWKQTAKRSVPYIRENEWELAQSTWIWVDQSQSMNFKSRPELPDKLIRAIVLALALCSLLIKGGERIALLGSGMPPVSNRSKLNEILEILMSPPQSNAGTPPNGENLPKNAHVIVISDFLFPTEKLEKIIRSMASKGIKGHMLQIYDPAEDNFPFSGRIRFDGLENEGSLTFGRAENIQAEFTRLISNHRNSVTTIAQSLGWTCTNHGTDQRPETALLALYNSASDQSGNHSYA